MNKTVFIALSLIFLQSCNKTIFDPENNIGGCLDPNSLNYDSTVDFENQSCEYAYIDQYEISYYPENDENNDDWDFDLLHLTGVYPADLILYIQEESDTFFYSHTIDNQPHNSPCYWTAPENKKLFNTKYSWELYDDDGLTSYDFIDSGSFNPIDIAINGKITSTNGQTQIVLHYSTNP